MKDQRKDAPTARVMERREFLGAGAAMGASAYLGSPGRPGVAEVGADSEMADPECCRRNRRELRRDVPAKTLNALWTGLWPRMAARIWLDPALSWPVKKDPTTGEWRDIGPDLQVWIESFLGTNNVSNPVSGPGNQLKPGDPAVNAQSLTDFKGNHRTDGSPEFQREMRALHAYLHQPLDAGRAPIRLVGEGAYDFILTEQGVDLWTPPDIRAGGATEAEQRQLLLDAYEFRRTGRPPLAIANVMEGAVDFPDAPTGPGQIASPVDMKLLLELCVNTGDGTALEYCGVREGAIRWIREAEARELDRGALEQELRQVLAALGATVDDIEAIVLASDPLEAFLEWLDDHRLAEDESCTPLSTELYRCALLTQRCWVLTGSVFRGVLEQFPREVADRWARSPNFDIRAIDPRHECEQRLEVRFPQRMRFEFTPPIGPDFVDALGIIPNPLNLATPLWDREHVMVTNTGLLFPTEIGDNGSAGSVGDLLTAIVTGRAGNPIFTDTRACM